VAGEIGLADALRDADLVLTGEGRYDGQSERGKVVSYVRGLAASAGCRTALVAGAIKAETSSFDAAVELTELAGSPERAMADPHRYLSHAATLLAQRFASGAHY
jgi:glycerate kinase